MKEKLEARIITARTKARCWMTVSIVMAVCILGFLAKASWERMSGTGTMLTSDSIPKLTLVLLIQSLLMLFGIVESRNESGIAHEAKEELKRLD